MAETVILKSNKYGINLLLDSDVEFPTLVNDIVKKFQEAEKFFRGARIAVAFEGRKLSGDEQIAIVNAVEENTDIRIICIMEQDSDMENRMKAKISDIYSQAEQTGGQFYKGTLRSGQVIESESSIVILGDVNPGAKIIAKGNIVVLGSLKGSAYAGAAGDVGAFVAALDMDPLQIRIADAIGRSSDKASWSILDRKRKSEPQVAIASDGCICINPITKGFMKTI